MGLESALKGPLSRLLSRELDRDTVGRAASESHSIISQSPQEHHSCPSPCTTYDTSCRFPSRAPAKASSLLSYRGCTLCPYTVCTFLAEHSRDSELYRHCSGAAADSDCWTPTPVAVGLASQEQSTSEAVNFAGTGMEFRRFAAASVPQEFRSFQSSPFRCVLPDSSAFP